MSADPDRACPHEDFCVEADVSRLTDVEDGPVTAYTVAIKIRCAICGEAFRWIGLQAGSSGCQPMCSIDESELHAPIRPASSDPDFGLGIPGFAIGWRAAE